MKAYSIFDDFTEEAVSLLKKSGVDVTVHPKGMKRPDDFEMESILCEYDCVIIGTSQKIKPEMFKNISGRKIIATASVGLDHIDIPESKKDSVTVVNAPKSNAQSVAEYTMGCALACVKRMCEGSKLYADAKNNKALHDKPEDLAGKTIGIIGAGNISSRIMDYANMFGMKIICYTAHPERHGDLKAKNGGVVEFVSLEDLVALSDVISVNLPNNIGTKGLISEELVGLMKDNAVFISISRIQTVDYDALFEKAKANPGFYVCLDIDVDDDVVKTMPHLPNVMITPHIAGGTKETRKRMFFEVADNITKLI